MFATSIIAVPPLCPSGGRMVLSLGQNRNEEGLEGVALWFLQDENIALQRDW